MSKPKKDWLTEQPYDVWDERINRMKKYGALLMLLVNSLFAVLTLTSGQPFGLLFVGTAFIILDYIKKFCIKPKDLPEEEKPKRHWKFWRKKEEPKTPWSKSET